MSKNFDSVEQRAWVGWVRTSQLIMDKVQQSLKEQGLPPLEWYDALLELETAEEEKLRFSELGERMLLKKFNVTRLIDRLVSEELVIREICDSDARGTYAVISSKGKKLRREMWPVYRDAVKQHFLDRLNQDELKKLTAIINKLL
jgi:DNA-binding MarR family transcriptional regulator